MKDSGLQTRDRASMVRLGAGVGRTDNPDSLSQISNFGSDGGKNSKLLWRGRWRKEREANSLVLSYFIFSFLLI